MIKPIRFAVLAGEDSGDILGADLMIALKERFPHATFEGIGGHRMLAQGLVSFYPMERLSVMGLFEPFKRLPEFIKLFYRLKNHWINQPPDAFIGIDAPDFNLRLEKTLKAKGIKTVHYVSPTVWAWRPGRLHKIKKAVDLMLGIFPFEKPIYEKSQIPMEYVGHPLADSIAMFSDQSLARRTLHLPSEGKLVALLPGSRRQELRYLIQPFIQTARYLLSKDPTIRFITACVNEEREEQWKEALKADPTLPIEIFLGRSMEVMAASDAVLLASGTASLQSMLIKRPTVVAYKMSPITYQIAKRVVKVKYIALPNILADKPLMPEYIQKDVDPQKMGEALWERLVNNTLNQKTIEAFEILHQCLRKKAGQSAAKAIESLIKEPICHWQESMKSDEVH